MTLSELLSYWPLLLCFGLAILSGFKLGRRSVLMRLGRLPSSILSMALWESVAREDAQSAIQPVKSCRVRE